MVNCLKVSVVEVFLCSVTCVTWLWKAGETRKKL